MRRVVSQDEMVQIALARFRPLSTIGQVTSLDALAEQFWRPKSTIVSAIQRALQRGLVNIRVSGSVPAGPLNSRRRADLERELVVRFPLVSAIVVATSSESDQLHRELGTAMAQEFRTAVRDYDRIGLGSGRGPFYTIRALTEMPPMTQEHVQLMSLTGAVYPQSHDRHLNALLDADFHTGLLSTAFTAPITQRMVSFPVAPPGVNDIRANTWLADAEFEKRVPTLAVVGVGVLSSGHRFWEAVTRNENGPSLHSVYSQLKALVKLADKYCTEDYCPVADVCNHLMFNDRPASTDRHIERADRDKIKALCDEINSSLLTVTLKQLGTIPGVCLVAGSRSKAYAIFRLLAGSRAPALTLRIRTVCIDAATAERVIAFDASARRS